MSTKGRIRLNESEAQLLAEILSETRHRLVVRRADARDKNESFTVFQHQITVVSDIQEELEHMMDEKLW
jgi:hypothetical protein